MSVLHAHTQGEGLHKVAWSICYGHEQGLEATRYGCTRYVKCIVCTTALASSSLVYFIFIYGYLSLYLAIFDERSGNFLGIPWPVVAALPLLGFNPNNCKAGLHPDSPGTSRWANNNNRWY